jgi:hypothetical protein
MDGCSCHAEAHRSQSGRINAVAKLGQTFRNDRRRIQTLITIVSHHVLNQVCQSLIGGVRRWLSRLRIAQNVLA